MAEVSVQSGDFDIGAEMEALCHGRTDIGAVVSFHGLVRDLPEGGLRAMTLEHYPGMTETALSRIVSEAKARWPLQACRVIHRYGRLEPGAKIVLVLTASPHRHAAFEAAAFIMDYLKTDAPFWKLEETPKGATWVDAREADTGAKQRWNLG